ncbi:NYN domain-containing protein [Allorhodopirellula heiligendammensis]|uniref:YacP-like NYN domain protein n=1 Tax=Allorhodopirellula heiligendammensis TaxID=2714739 RepID=A0A5C6BHM3_9BACT|nr:NYN domain-containing protein [Allorhodopirellula heiligendammensis]TWU11041.1 YacP-like NYN domain protein [Allorhodopirellula heiligendammensis]
MSVVLLIDGYNVIAPVAPPGRGASRRWLDVERQRLLDRLVEHLDENVRLRTCVVFDAKDAPTHLASQYLYQGIDVRFAVDYPEADDLLEEIIAQHAAPKTLSVVSSDHRIATSARRRRAGCFDSDTWLDLLLDGRPPLIKVPKSKKRASAAAPELAGSPPTDAHNDGADPIDVQVESMISDDLLENLLGKLK